MLIKLVLVALLLLVIVNLFYALYYMIKNDEQSAKMSTYLGRRLLLSALVILGIILALATGLIAFNTRPF